LERYDGRKRPMAYHSLTTKLILLMDYCWIRTKSIKNIEKEGNTLERETAIAFKVLYYKNLVTLD
jgi:hypothetical protein